MGLEPESWTGVNPELWDRLAEKMLNDLKSLYVRRY